MPLALNCLPTFFPPQLTLLGLSLRTLLLLTKPSVVAVNGLAVGGAANIALANYHDIVLASTDAYFKYPFAELGITPELGSSFVIPLMAGMTRAKNLMMMAPKFTAEEAKEMGLVLEVTKPEDLMDRARHYAETLASRDQSGLRANKKLMNHHFRKMMGAVLEEENVVLNERFLALVKKMAPPKKAKM